MGGAGSSLDTLLIEVFQSYRYGLLRRPAPPFPPRNLSSIVFLSTIEQIPLKERAALSRLSRVCEEGLAAARQGQLEAASDHFKRAQLYFDAMAEVGRLARLLGVSTYQPSVAYLDFKSDGFEDASRRLDLAMDADLELELSGWLFMQARRIQQGHNMARMDFLRNRRSVAIGLTGDLVAYMEGRIDRLGYHCGWRPRFLQEVPKDVLRFLIREIVGETVGRIVTGGSSEEEWRHLISATRLFQNSDSTILPQAQYALLAQSKRLSGKAEDYLDNVKQFFGLGIRRCHLLWYAMLIEFFNFCKEVDTSCSRQIREVIKRDSSKWKDFPSYLGHLLEGHEDTTPSGALAGTSIHQSEV